MTAGRRGPYDLAGVTETRTGVLGGLRITFAGTGFPPYAVDDSSFATRSSRDNRPYMWSPPNL
jgi:hypothetical protein